MRRHFTYANIVATLALFITLGGGAYAAATINGATIRKKSIPLDRLKGPVPGGERGAAGPQGPAGPQGSQGLRGPAGEPGAQGATGLTGATGPQGPGGQNGSVGPAGAQGAKGDVGAQGVQGVAGLAGPQGPKGDPGVVGTTRFRLSSIVNQPNGAPRTVLKTTGLAAGDYFVSFSLLMTAVQRYDCGIQFGGPDGSYGLVVRKKINSDGNPEEFQGFGVVSVPPGVSGAPVLTCRGYTADWSASGIEMNFIPLSGITDGVNG